MKMSNFYNSQVALRVCVIVVFLASCSSSVSNIDGWDLTDGGFLSGEPCSPPCFFNITPGITTISQAKDVIRDLGLIQDCEDFDNTSESGGRGIICRPKLIVTFENDQDNVAGIGFQPSTSITVAEAINKYDDPDAVLVTSSGLPESGMRIAMTLYYDDIRTTLQLPEQEGMTYKLENATMINSASYYNKTSYQASRQYASAWRGLILYELSNQ